MTFDLEKYEEAILSQDETRRVEAGLGLAEAVSHLDRETLERLSQPIVDLLLEALRKMDWEFRNLISNALIQLGKFDFIAKSTWFWRKLISTYTDADSGLRSSAMDLLKELGRSEYSLEILEPLIEGLKNSDKDMRILSANTLGRIRAREVIPILLEALQDDNTNVVYNVVECLGDIGDPRAVPALMHLLNTHVDEWVRAATLEALGKIGDQRVVELLLSLVNKELVVDPLINALGTLGDSRAIPVLVNYLKAEDRDIRELALKALVTIWEEVVTIAEFTGVHYELEATKNILQQSLTANVKNILLRDMNDENAPDDVRENCAVLLSCVKYAKALVPIVSLLEKFPLSQKVICALGQYHKRAFSHLRPYLQHKDSRLRQSAGLYVQHLVEKDIRGYDAQIEQALLQLVQDENPILNQIALATLKKFQSTTTIPALLNMLQQFPEDYGETIIDILVTLPKRSVYHAIQERIDEQNERTFPYFIKLLGHTGVQLDYIKNFLKHQNSQIQEASLLAIGYTAHSEGIPLLLPFIMSRQNSLARCAAAQSVYHLIQQLKDQLPKPRNVFDALFVMLNTHRNEEELCAVAQPLGTLCSYKYPDISEVNVAVVRGRLLDLLPRVGIETKIHLLEALYGIIDMSSFSILRELRHINLLEIQKMVASLYSQLDRDLRVIADIADMISHAEYSYRKFWIAAAGRLQAVELTDMLIPLLADPDFRAETFYALVNMGIEGLPRLVQYLNYEDPRIQKMAALVLSKISQDRIDKFCQAPCK
ncbi:Alr1903 protein [Candidatus Vecturithrix granuli]|uniref:Alr1903 protein n=1 Tax=Vecturithrix granuli TaxID=1499967 RepID=A0A081BVP2_VECG1|nr:Alr1903 protein [Candidatus Vecturithrix granuli]